MFETQLRDTLANFQQSNPAKDSLAMIKDRNDLLKWLFRYVTFNGIFAGGVSNLSGEVHTRTALFQDKTDAWKTFADRSASIAAHIFYAAEDEYGGHQHHTGRQLHHHRYLAGLLIKEIADFLGIAPADFEQRYCYSYPAMEQTLAAVLRGYCVNQINSEEILLKGIGFHLGSEHLADGEFNALDGYLRQTQPEMVQHLRHKGKPNAYTWVALHTTVEAEHAEHAIIAATEAARFFSGNANPQQAQQWILDGIAQFAQVQAAFFAHILS